MYELFWYSIGPVQVLGYQRYLKQKINVLIVGSNGWNSGRENPNITSKKKKKVWSGSKGIRQMQINWCLSPNDYTQNYLFYRLQLVVETFAHST